MADVGVDEDDDDDECSVICAFGRLELDVEDDDVYDECRDGDEVAEAGDEGRKTAKNRKKKKHFANMVI